jgi:outer membrane protein OmpA-like peptidoglycan-associated protein
MKILLSSAALLLCPALLYAQGDSVKIEIKNIGTQINSAFADFAPVISADASEMIFTSRRPVSEKEQKKSKQSKEQVYSASYDSKKKEWSLAKMLPSTINVEGRNNSAIALSNDGQRMLLYRDDDSGNGDIYESILQGSEWSVPVSLGEPINSSNHESSASIAPDGRTIYFVSNRGGGKGGRDIWYCTQDASGKWGAVKNLGEPVNTKTDEEGVFIHPDGKTLYFSSKGHNSTGGYDIFKTSLNKDGTWSKPVSLGPQINTPGDDVYFVMEASGMAGYYSSSMPGGSGEKDIYKVTFTPIETKKIPTGPRLTLLRGYVIDEETLKPIQASIVIMDNEKNQEISRLTSNGKTGKFLISLPSGKNYGISVTAQGYLFHSENYIVPDTAAYTEVDKVIELKKLEVGKKIVLNNIFYDFDKATLRQESISELERLVSLMKDTPALKIEISSHTDNKGTDDYNQKLSQARAQSVVDYLVSKGIARTRLVAKGYGESQPIATNDTDPGRQMNRRTEFKVLGM